jgi:hypothetical protein|uniref:Uncharacterized protein n=1 Tax=viral metagenome TaxID=1070528 RepID=A0A6C0LJS9_9ZZZZ
MSGIYDERYGDIWFEEEDPTSEFYNPKCCRDVYIDLVNGVFDVDLNDYEDEEEEEEDEDYWEYYAGDEFADF